MKTVLLDNTLSYEPKLMKDVSILRFDPETITYSKLVRLLSTRKNVTDVGLFQMASPKGDLMVLKKESGGVDALAGFLLELKSRMGLKRFDFIGASLYQDDKVRNNIKTLQAKTGVDLRSSIVFGAQSATYVKQLDNRDARFHYMKSKVVDMKELLYVVDPSLKPVAAPAPVPTPASLPKPVPAPAPVVPAPVVPAPAPAPVVPAALPKPAPAPAALPKPAPAPAALPKPAPAPAALPKPVPVPAAAKPKKQFKIKKDAF